MMLMFGTSIQSPADELRKVQEAYLHNSLVRPKPAIRSAIERLRTIYALDAHSYSQLKRRLPYIVCGMFNPPFRRSENFAYTDRFILDFDHLSGKELNAEELRAKICSDSRVMMCFLSPSQDGLKVMFSLKDRCYDRGIYSQFYKAFAGKFASAMQLDQVLDSRTSDVTRACFVSVDPNAYFNPEAAPVDITDFSNLDSPLELADQHREQTKLELETKPQPAHAPSNSDPTKEVMAKIRATLNPTSATAKKEVYVPDQLNDAISPICDDIRKRGIEVEEVLSIQYGKKVRAKLGFQHAEVNIFFGKRGYSVVESPRRGTNAELNTLVADIIRSFLFELPSIH